MGATAAEVRPGGIRRRSGSRRLLVGLLGGVAAASLAVGLASAAPSPRARPTLALVRLAPAVVSGRGFRPHTRVSLRFTAGRRLVRIVRTDGRGSFTRSLGTRVDRCSAWTLIASEPGGPTVRVRSFPAMCAPMSAP